MILYKREAEEDLNILHYVILASSIYNDTAKRFTALLILENHLILILNVQFGVYFPSQKSITIN